MPLLQDKVIENKNRLNKKTHLSSEKKSDKNVTQNIHSFDKDLQKKLLMSNDEINYYSDKNPVQQEPVTKAVISDHETQQTRNKPVTEPVTNSVIALNGNELIITRFLFGLCFDLGTYTTLEISLKNIASNTNIRSIGAIRVSIYRLINKGFLIKERTKYGRGGWIILRFPIYIYKELYCQTSNNSVAARNENQVTEFTNNKNTTIDMISDLTSDWQSIDISPLDSIKFTINHLTQIFLQNKLTHEQVQESINAFAFDLKTNKRQFKTGPLNFFIGILKSGQIYNPSENYESPRDRSLRIFLENQKNMKQERESLEKEAYELAFENWKSELTLDKMAELLEIKKDYLKPGKIMDSQLSSHFSQSIWPIIRKESGF